MKLATVVSLLLIGTPLLVFGQESASTIIASGRLPLAIIDPQAVEAWNKALHSTDVFQPAGPLDPKFTGTTLPFLVSLTGDKEILGRFRFKQRCAMCHEGGGGIGITGTPRLTKKNVMGREDFVRKIIIEGGSRMPSFKNGMGADQAGTIDAIIAYLKRVEPTERQQGAGAEQ